MGSRWQGDIAGRSSRRRPMPIGDPVSCGSAPGQREPARGNRPPCRVALSVQPLVPGDAAGRSRRNRPMRGGYPASCGGSPDSRTRTEPAVYQEPNELRPSRCRRRRQSLHRGPSDAQGLSGHVRPRTGLRKRTLKQASMSSRPASSQPLVPGDAAGRSRRDRPMRGGYPTSCGGTPDSERALKPASMSRTQRAPAQPLRGTPPVAPGGIVRCAEAIQLRAAAHPTAERALKPPVY